MRLITTCSERRQGVRRKLRYQLWRREHQLESHYRGHACRWRAFLTWLDSLPEIKIVDPQIITLRILWRFGLQWREWSCELQATHGDHQDDSSRERKDRRKNGWPSRDRTGDRRTWDWALKINENYAGLPIGRNASNVGCQFVHVRKVVNLSR